MSRTSDGSSNVDTNILMCFDSTTIEKVAEDRYINCMHLLCMNFIIKSMM